MRARIEVASIDGTPALDLSALSEGLGPSHAAAATHRPRSWGREGCPGRFVPHGRPGHSRSEETL